MSANVAVVEGMVNSDGTLVLDGKVDLPVGRVKVTVELTYDLSKDPFWMMMERIWADQKARGYVPRSKDEIDAEIKALRDEAEEELLAAERLHEECQTAQQQTKSKEG